MLQKMKTGTLLTDVERRNHVVASSLHRRFYHRNFLTANQRYSQYSHHSAARESWARLKRQNKRRELRNSNLTNGKKVLEELTVHRPSSTIDVEDDLWRTNVHVTSESTMKNMCWKRVQCMRKNVIGCKHQCAKKVRCFNTKWIK